MTSEATDQQALMELVQRLLIQPYPYGPTSVELLPGRLPPDRSIAFPLPTGGRLVGSAVYRRDGSTTSVEAVVDLAAPSATALRAYEEQLHQAGWNVFGMHHGGFSPANSWMPRSFRHQRGGPALVVNVVERGKQATSFRLRLDWEMPQQPRPHQMNDGMELIPSLLAPLNVEMEGGGGGGGDSHWSSSATAHTDMPASALEAYFAEQLTGAGWTRIAGDGGDPVAWSTWKVPGSRPWIGLLLVVPFERDERSLLVHLHSPARRRDRSQAWVTARRRGPLPWWRRISFRGPPWW
jgi:hypothetical protein